MPHTPVLLVVLLGCTKPNPNRCCTDEADCQATGIPVGSTCDDGLLCRGHQCVAITCEAVAEYDASAPYCVAGACAEACGDDSHCPGLAQSDTARYCVASSCVECRDSGDCSASAPICDQGSCRACAAHDECASGVCAKDGACASPEKIAYVDINGAAMTECTETAPCSSLAHALSIVPERRYIRIAPGMYASVAALSMDGERHLIGVGPTRPILTRSTLGAIFSLTGSVVVTFEHLEISGAQATAGDDGDGIRCEVLGGTPHITLVDTLLRQNADNGIRSYGCNIDAIESEFVGNRAGVTHIDGNTSFSRCLVVENGHTGLYLDSGVHRVLNNIIARNGFVTSIGPGGLSVFSFNASSRVEFNTIIDNGYGSDTGYGFECNIQTTTSVFPNNIIVRNKVQTTGTACSFPGSLISGDIAGLNFKSADAAPYDYHLQAGSIAIDAAVPSTVTDDFDGDVRPYGAQPDVGADEFVP